MMNKWIKCSDQMPPQKDEESLVYVLCCNTAGDVWVAWFDYEDFTWTTIPSTSHKDLFLPEYWMSLPNLPNGGVA